MKINLSFNSDKSQSPLAPIANLKDYKLAIISKDAQILKVKLGELRSYKPANCIVVLNHPAGFNLLKYLQLLGKHLECINPEMEIEIDTNEVDVSKVQPAYFIGFK